MHSVIYDISTKKQVFSNTQTSNHITEIVSIAGTTATETQEKMRRDGFEFVLNADGSVTQKSKKQENKCFFKLDCLFLHADFKSFIPILTGYQYRIGGFSIRNPV